ncbi:MAG: helix-turn-helix domain-containing protein, partial [Planctomycetaceae bacterium]|nr:helix-turn-helix domain-containing protein [Planctomycetaceae bacterium]
MIRFEISEQELAAINKERFYHPDPIVMKRCETVLLRVKGFSTQQIHEITGRSPNTIRHHLHLYQQGGLEALKNHQPYQPKSQLDDHRQTIEQSFQDRPPDSIKEAGERIFQLTGIRRSKSNIEVFVKRLGMSFRKTGSVP